MRFRGVSVAVLAAILAGSLASAAVSVRIARHECVCLMKAPCCKTACPLIRSCSDPAVHSMVPMLVRWTAIVDDDADAFRERITIAFRPAAPGARAGFQRVTERPPRTSNPVIA